MPKNNPHELQYWIAFNQLSEFGPKRFTKLLNYFPNLETAWQADRNELTKSGLVEKIIDKFITSKTEIDPAKELDKVTKQNIEVVTIKDDAYPSQLKQIPNPPPLLYTKGGFFLPEDEFAIAVVGTRKITPYGKQVTEDLVSELTRNGLVIVSGLALGIDAKAHAVCISSKGRTIAVLGNGIDNIYPSANVPLARRILDNNGLIISEFPLGTPSYRSNFPHRNRIISGLTLGTLIIEADIKSGSLITAKQALEQNREVFTVPGSIYSPSSKGPNQLLKQGAIPVTTAQDILQALNLNHIPQIIKTKTLKSDTPEEQKIIELLQVSNKTIDELIKQTKLDAWKINSILTGMELKSMVKNIGGTYSLTR